MQRVHEDDLVAVRLARLIQPIEIDGGIGRYVYPLQEGEIDEQEMAFWERRDPNPATLVNEFMEEHYRRFEYAVRVLGRDAPRPGWKTDRGKYYELMRTLDTYDEVTELFGECTSCHSRKPGSQKLTAMGRRFPHLVEDMDGLKQLLDTEHPTSVEEIDPMNKE